jgi:small subunit ribosomal protein S8|uniref:Ribosomal protein S8 n=1 Tax=Baffinella frigidus TaxID=2571260 RepID=A0A6C0X6D6_9CRYP|nr:ribosomal protein S8 [Cryptophyta sp. CCMP2293]
MGKLFSMLNCIKNAQNAGQNCVFFCYSNYLYFILNILVEEGFLKGFLIIQNKTFKKEFCILLKYKNDRPVIKKMCVKLKDLSYTYKVSNGVGIKLVSTSRGIMTGDSAYYTNVGGKFLFSIH